MLKTLTLSICLLTIASAMSAQDQGTQERMNGSPLFAAIDGNGDGVITPGEIDRAADSLRGLDRNNDGNLDPQELGPQNAGRSRIRNGQAGEPGRPGQPGKGNREMPNGRAPDGTNGKPGLARNGGGSTPGPNFVDRLFQFDKDNDGKLSREELQSVGQGKLGPGKPGQGNNDLRNPRDGEKRNGNTDVGSRDRMDENMRRPDRGPPGSAPSDRQRDGKGKGDGGKGREKPDRNDDDNLN